MFTYHMQSVAVCIIVSVVRSNFDYYTKRKRQIVK